MMRFADYFVIVGYDHEKERSGVRSGKILQRFPETDWPDTPFIEGIEWFCQPLGWSLSTNRDEPKFFVSVLTDIDANRHYCACLCFNETVAITPNKPIDEEEETDSLSRPLPGASTPAPASNVATITHHSIMYAPKCLVLVSRLDYTETFRNCLGTIYTVYIESLNYPLETLIGNILGCIQVPPPGGPQVRFSIGAGDKQVLQPPQSPTIPVTGTCVDFLFQQLGIKNVMLLFCSVMTEQKILFHSKSYSRLTDSCRALVALMYPFRYSHVYIPILPASLIEVLSTPTPFIMGVHSSLQSEIQDMYLQDVIVADIDGGAIDIPAQIVPPVAQLPESLWVSVQQQLTMVLQPELQVSDYAFTPPPATVEPVPYNGGSSTLVGPSSVTNGTLSSLNASITSIASISSNASLSNAATGGQITRSNAMRDKEIRAVFMRMFAILLQGYRSCLTLIRIHPKPVIEFHKAQFLGARDLLESDFLSRVLDSMFFTGFVHERGPPWRPCDAWDELYSAMTDLLRTEQQQERLLMVHIRELAQILYSNENPPTQQPYQQRVLRPTEGAFARIHQPTMPKIDGGLVQAIIREGTSKNDLPSRFHQMRQQPRIVPMGPHLQISGGCPVINNTARRLEVLRTCVNCIFENKIADARKSFPAVLRMMSQRDARLALCRELARGVHGNKSMLDNQQFHLVTALMNRALREDAAIGEYSVAAALLPLATAFCRKLCTGVIQFIYTAIQNHPVWKNQQFWEAAFYQDVQMQIKALYMTRAPTASPGGGSLSGDYSWSATNRLSSPSGGASSLLVSRSQEPSALEIAAEQMRIWPTLDVAKQNEYVGSEESTLYSQTIHYANRMVSLLIPPDVNSGGKVHGRGVGNDHGAFGGGGGVGGMGGGGSHLNADGVDVHETRSVSNSVVESQRSHSEEHNSDEGFEECDPGETGSAVAKMVSRFIDKVCTEGSVTAEHVRNLHAMVPGVIHMHIETLEAVHREMKRVPPVQKPKIQSPPLLPGEVLLGEPLRTYLMSDGRGEDVGSNYFPAEGALFLTNYRVVFKGSPCDELTCEQSVVRAFPVAALTKEKRLTMLFLPHLGQTMPEGLQLRSSTFQLIKIAFDEEVTLETIEAFRKQIGRCRYPADEFGFFAFAMAQGMVIPAPMHKVKEKNATLKGFAKKTLLRTAKKAGFKQKGTTKRKYILSGIEDVDENSHSGGGGSAGTENLEEDDGSDDGVETMPRVTVKDVDRLKERSYVKDWQRIGLGDPQGTGYRISTVNCNYSLCRSYPAIIVAPNGISDEQLRGLSRCYKNQRVPVATWRHRNGAVLLRGALPLAKGVIGMLKGHPGSGSGSTHAERESTGSHAEQDRYFMTVIQTMPDTMTVNKSWGLSDSSLSINSLMLAAADDPYLSLQHQLMTPDTSARRGNLYQTKPGNYSTYDPHNKAQMKQSSKWGSLRATPGLTQQQQQQQRDELDMSGGSSQWFQRVPLLIIGEKNQSKSVRLSENLAKFIAVDYTDVRHSRLAFKKLMRTCLPSNVSTEPDQTFAVLLEQSDWLQQIRGLLQLAGAIVDLMDCQGSSVTLALEDGWDVTAQISALAQLCLDPYYRTIEGFRVLIEKEWLAFGHRFGHRSNLRPNSSSGSPFAPTFLQFLDAVHQIWVQYPLAFEFNDYYLRFLAYHSVSCRFRTFLFDCELERFDLGIAAVDDKRGSLTSAHKNVVDAGAGSDDESIYPGGLRTGTGGSSQTVKLGQSVFDYIERQHLKSPIFYNFMYVTELETRVLRPQSSLAVLELWEYYVDEELAHGQAYDPELVGGDTLDEEEEDEVVDEETGRRCPKNKVVTIGYDSLAKSIPDAFTRLLEELKVAEGERGLLPQKWKQVWDKLELPHSDSLTRNASFSSALVRSHGRLLHKRSTLEILMRGRLSGHHQESFSHPHRFEKYVFTTLTHCNYCGSLLWGPIGDGRRCIDCGNAYHEKCADSVPKNCTKYKAVDGGVQQTLTRSQGDNGSISSSATTGHASRQYYYDQFSSNVAENRTHEGHLYKRGALLKGWKQRWFVLDSIKHQLRYYDAMEDSHYKGLIDLAEVQSVTQGPAVPVGTKKVDEKAFFDLKTSRRVYNFYAGNAVKAQEWIEKIQACLQ